MAAKPQSRARLVAWLAAGIAACGQALPVTAQGQAVQEPDPAFVKLDINRDGYLSRDEWRAGKGEPGAFDQADDNHDGRLDQNEFVKAESLNQRILAERYVDDSIITAKVKTALLKDPDVSAFAIRVETYRGTVQLSGFVDEAKQAREAGQIASGVRGVREIRNNLIVKK